MIHSSNTHQMQGTQFPFGIFKFTQSEMCKVLVKRRYYFGDSKEKALLMEKVSKLKNVSHKNTINLRSVNQTKNSIDLLYQYVPMSLQRCFAQNPSQTVKEMHRQFIQLAIYLAKSCVLTNFDASRCGVVTNDDGKNTLKYYLPLHEITLTSNRSMLQRSVQLFNVQSMHYLDTINSQGLNISMHQSHSQRTFKNRVKLFNHHGKQRRDSQPTGMIQTNERKMSGNLGKKNEAMRKLSTLSKELSQISQIHNRHRASTRCSRGSINTNTFQSIISIQSQKCNRNVKRFNLQSTSGSLKRCLSLNKVTVCDVESVIARSKKALDYYRQISKNMASLRGLCQNINILHTEN